MCSPAMLVGPRVFLTAAHCMPLISQDGNVRLVGPGYDKQIHVTTLSMKVVSDEMFFAGANCKALIQSLPDGSALSREQLAKCWFNEGAGDLALLVADEDLQSPMLSLDTQATRENERLSRLGENAKCGGDLGFFHQVQLDVAEFTGAQFILSNSVADQSRLADCGGDSGGIYYRTRSDGSVHLAGIHSASIRNPGPYTVHGKSIVLPSDLYGGTNLSSQTARDWLHEQVLKNDLKICGINMHCSNVRLTEGGSL